MLNGWWGTDGSVHSHAYQVAVKLPLIARKMESGAMCSIEAPIVWKEAHSFVHYVVTFSKAQTDVSIRIPWSFVNGDIVLEVLYHLSPLFSGQIRSIELSKCSLISTDIRFRIVLFNDFRNCSFFYIINSFLTDHLYC